MAIDRAWLRRAVDALDAEFSQSVDTPILELDLPKTRGVRLYLKDESRHPSGSLKHRLARSLILFGLCNGWIREGEPIIEASSGSTAISEAYFAKLIGARFIAVVPRSTARRKIDAICAFGGEVHEAACASEIDSICLALAADTGGCFLDQFTNAERATDWRGNNNIAESMFAQVAAAAHTIPDWIVVGAGTGGTSTTIGRYIRYRTDIAARTRLCVVDPVGSAFFRAFRNRAAEAKGAASSIVEGIGRPRVEPSFTPSVIDRMLAIPDEASVAACLWLEAKLGRRCGPSTGANLIGALALATEMFADQRTGTIASLICDGGDLYADTVYCPEWREARRLDLSFWQSAFAKFDADGAFSCVLDQASAA